MKRLTKVCVSLVLMLVLAASMASIASAVNQSFPVEGRIGISTAVTPSPEPTPGPSATPAPSPSPGITPKPTLKPTATPGGGGGGSGGGGTTSPKTGDDASIGLYAMAGLTSIIMLILLWRKREDRDEAPQGS